MSIVLSILESGNPSAAASVLMDKCPSIAAMSHTNASRGEMLRAIRGVIDSDCLYEPSAKRRSNVTGTSSGCLKTWGRRSVRGGAR